MQLSEPDIPEKTNEKVAERSVATRVPLEHSAELAEFDGVSLQDEDGSYLMRESEGRTRTVVTASASAL